MKMDACNRPTYQAHHQPKHMGPMVAYSHKPFKHKQNCYRHTRRHVFDMVRVFGFFDFMCGGVGSGAGGGGRWQESMNWGGGALASNILEPSRVGSSRGR